MKQFLRSSLPEQNEIRKVFLLLLIYSNTFAYIGFAKVANTLVNYFNLWDILGILGYDLMTALFEAIFVLIILLIFALVLPKDIFADHFVSRSMVGFLVVLAFLYPLVAPLSAQGLDEFNIPLLQGDSVFLVLIVWAGMIGVFGFLIAFALSRPIILNGFNNLVERLNVLGSIFLTLDVVSILLVLFRNMWPGV